MTTQTALNFHINILGSQQATDLGLAEEVKVRTVDLRCSTNQRPATQRSKIVCIFLQIKRDPSSCASTEYLSDFQSLKLRSQVRTCDKRKEKKMVHPNVRLVLGTWWCWQDWLTEATAINYVARPKCWTSWKTTLFFSFFLLSIKGAPRECCNK